MRWCVGTGIAGLVLSVSAGIVQAQSGGDYDLSWSTIDGGGAMRSTGGDYELSGTIGQPDAGEMSGGDYTLQGGFWLSVPEIPPSPGVPATSHYGLAVTLALVAVAGAFVVRRNAVTGRRPG